MPFESLSTLRFPRPPSVAKREHVPTSKHEGKLALYGYGAALFLRPGKDIAVIDFEHVMHGVCAPFDARALRGDFCVSLADWGQACRDRRRRLASGRG